MFWSTGPKILDDCETTEERGMVKINKMWFQWWSPACQERWRSSPTSPRSPDSSRRMLASRSMLSIFGVATAHIFIADFWTFHLNRNTYVLPFTVTASCQLRRMKISKVSLSLFWNNSNVFSCEATSTSVGTQYLNCRPGVSVIEM